MTTNLEDVLAYLARKRANAQTMVNRSPEFEAEARWSVRQIDIISEDLRAGLHHGEAALQAGIGAEAAEDAPSPEGEAPCTV